MAYISTCMPDACARVLPARHPPASPCWPQAIDTQCTHPHSAAKPQPRRPPGSPHCQWVWSHARRRPLPRSPPGAVAIGSCAADGRSALARLAAAPSRHPPCTCDRGRDEPTAGPATRLPCRRAARSCTPHHSAAPVKRTGQGRAGARAHARAFQVRARRCSPTECAQRSARVATCQVLVWNRLAYTRQWRCPPECVGHVRSGSDAVMIYTFEGHSSTLTVLLFKNVTNSGCGHV